MGKARIGKKAIEAAQKLMTRAAPVAKKEAAVASESFARNDFMSSNEIDSLLSEAFPKGKVTKTSPFPNAKKMTGSVRSFGSDKRGDLEDFFKSSRDKLKKRESDNVVDKTDWVDHPDYVSKDIKDAAESNWADQLEDKISSKQESISKYKGRPETSKHKTPRANNTASDAGGMGESIHPEAQGYLDAANTPAAPKSLERMKFDKLAAGGSKGEAYKIDRLSGKYNAHMDALESEAGRAAVGRDIGVDGSKLSKEEMHGKVHSFYGDRMKEKATTMDHMWGNKVPQKAAGGLITASVVGSLYNSRGQQSNSQLYGQSAGPGQQG